MLEDRPSILVEVQPQAGYSLRVAQCHHANGEPARTANDTAKWTRLPPSRRVSEGAGMFNDGRTMKLHSERALITSNDKRPIALLESRMEEEQR